MSNLRSHSKIQYRTDLLPEARHFHHTSFSTSLFNHPLNTASQTSGYPYETPVLVVSRSLRFQKRGSTALTVVRRRWHRIIMEEPQVGPRTKVAQFSVERGGERAYQDPRVLAICQNACRQLGFKLDSITVYPPELSLTK